MSQQIDDAALVERFPYVKIDHDSKHLYRGWLDERLLINRCDDCSRFHHPPKPVCPSCWSSSLTPTEVSGRGVIHLAMFLHQGPPAPDVDYAKAPHPVVSIELEEQEALRFTSTVIGCPLEDVRIGLPVELAWIDRFGAPFPVFREREAS
ncbi:MAG: zinc ribbon domain-containing protein [Myxococcota bacterium]|nr:zinc ribbon domain-containing protein [Myxococcota bacterium]